MLFCMARSPWEVQFTRVESQVIGTFEELNAGDPIAQVQGASAQNCAVASTSGFKDNLCVDFNEKAQWHLWRSHKGVPSRLPTPRANHFALGND